MDVAKLYSLMLENNTDVLENSKNILANIVIESLMFGRRLGLEYEEIFTCANKKINIGIDENHEIEKYYNDLSDLKKIRVYKIRLYNKKIASEAE